MVRTFRLCFGLLLTVVLAACSKDSPLPTGPIEPQDGSDRHRTHQYPHVQFQPDHHVVQQIATGPVAS